MIIYTVQRQENYGWRHVEEFATLNTARETAIQRSLESAQLMRVTQYKLHERVPILYAIHGSVLIPEELTK